MPKQIFVFLLLCFSFSANSQISIYGSAGINSSDINISSEIGNLSFEHESFIQPFLTFGIATPISNKLYWVGELSYSASGYKFSETETKVRYNMLNFQTGLGYQFGPLRIEGGGFIGTSLSDQVKSNDSEWADSFFNSESIVLGAFVGLNLSVTKNIGIFARNYRGITPISEIMFTDFSGELAGTFEEKINNYQFGISIQLF